MHYTIYSGNTVFIRSLTICHARAVATFLRATAEKRELERSLLNHVDYTGRKSLLICRLQQVVQETKQTDRHIDSFNSSCKNMTGSCDLLAKHIVDIFSLRYHTPNSTTNTYRDDVPCMVWCSMK